MKLHLPKMLLAAVVMACSVAQAAVTTAESITVSGTTYTGTVKVMDASGDVTAENLTGADYVVITPNRTELTTNVLSTATDGKLPTIVVAQHTTSANGTAVTPGELFLNAWSTSSGIKLDNDFILGSCAHGDGALRLHEAGSKAKSIVLTGTITLAQNAEIGVSTGAYNYLEGAIQAEGKTLELNYVGVGATINLSGGGTIGTLTGNLNNIVLDATKADGTTAAAGTSYTIGALTTTGTVTVDEGVTLTIGSTIKTGTLNLNGSLEVESLDGLDYTTVDPSGTENGTGSWGKVYTVSTVTNNGSTTTVTYNGDEYNIADGINQTTSGYIVVKDTVYVGGTAPTDGTKDATAFYVKEDATLELGARESGAALTTDQVIATTEGSGTIDLKTKAVLGYDSSTAFKGTIKISTGGELYLGTDYELGETGSRTADVSNLTAFELAGGKLQFRGGSIALGDINVSAAGSTLSLYDQNTNTAKISIGTLSLNANLAIANRWKSNVAIEKLTGSGNATFGAVAPEDGQNHRYVHIKSMEGYTGTLTFPGNDKHTQELKLGNGGALGTAFSTGKIITGDYVNVVINGQGGGATATQASGAQQLTYLELGNNTNVKSLDGSYNFTELKLQSGATATLQHEWNKFQFIEALVGEDAELILKRTRQTGYSAHTQGAAYVLDGAGKTNYSGIINLQNASEDNQGGLIVKNDTTGTKLANTVVKFTGDGNKSILAFATNDYTLTANTTLNGPTGNNAADGTVAGLDGDKGNVYAAKLTVDVADTKEYTYGGGLNVASLKKAGSGTQNISGDMSAFNGTVEVAGGTLGFTNSAENANTTISSLTLSGGSLDVTGSLTLNALSIDLSKYSTDQEIHTLVSAGTLSLGAGVNLSSLGGNVGNYTATVEQSGSTITLSLKLEDVTSTDWSLVGTPSYDPARNMLTLNVGADLLDYDFTNNGAIIIPGIDDAMMKDILGLSGLPADGMVGITLLGGDDESVTATADQQIGFQGKDGVSTYFGVNVDGNWVYQVAYIPEPASATLGLAALMMLAARRRRKA